MFHKLILRSSAEMKVSPSLENMKQESGQVVNICQKIKTINNTHERKQAFCPI